MRRTSLTCLVACSACGRVAFEQLAHTDAGDIDAPGSGVCDVTTPFQPPVPVPGLATSGLDVTLRLEDNELAGLFWSNRSGDADIWAATRPDLASAFTATIVPDLSSVGPIDADPTLPPDGSFVVFASPRAGGAGSFDLYEAQRTGALTYTSPLLLVPLETASTDGQPNWSPAENALYFMSDRSGSAQLYRSIRTGMGAYGAPVLVSELVTTAQDYDPVPSADGLVLYFRSSRGGDPNGDVFVSTRAAIGDPWGAPVAVNELTSTAVDGPSFLSPDRCRLYMTSDRGGMPQLYVASRAN